MIYRLFFLIMIFFVMGVSNILAEPARPAKERAFESFTARSPHGTHAIAPQPVAVEYARRIQHALVMLGIALLGAGLMWRGGALTWLFFRLWKRKEGEELFDEKATSGSALVPPVSLFLDSGQKASELLMQIDSIQNVDYEQLEILVFRDAAHKGEDARLFHDFRLRYRSPLYFSDLDSEDPLEIMEMQGRRRILLVYYLKKNLRTLLLLFLKLSRYPLVGFLSQEVKLAPEAISSLVYRWLREKGQKFCVYGFVEAPRVAFALWPLMALGRQRLLFNDLFNDLAAENIEQWINQNDFFSLMSKSSVIQSLEQDWENSVHPFRAGAISSLEVSGQRIPKKWAFEDYKIPIQSLWLSFSRTVQNIFDCRASLSQLAVLASALGWFFILASFALAGIVDGSAMDIFTYSILYLFLAEAALLGISSIIWNLFAQRKSQALFFPCTKQ